MSPTVLDPTDETTPAELAAAARPESLAGLTVGLLDISKPEETCSSIASKPAR